MNINPGDLVSFKQGLYADEASALYRVVEVNGDRCILELVDANLPFPPQSVAALAELDLAGPASAENKNSNREKSDQPEDQNIRSEAS